MNVQDMDRLVNELRCSYCSNFLNFPPISLLPSGNSICGHCAPAIISRNPVGLIVRQRAFEKALRMFTFPCKYQSSGCKTRTLFGAKNHNEKDCNYRTLPCPLETCLWLGSIFAMPRHVAESHKTLVKNELEFKVVMDKDSQGNIFAMINKLPYLVRYTYISDEFELVFRIHSLSMNKSVYKIWLWNGDCGECREYGASIKRKVVHPYINLRDDVVTLKLDKYLPALQDPKCVVVVPNIEIRKNVFTLLPEVIVLPPYFMGCAHGN